MSWSTSWRLAVGTLTVLPVRPPETVDRVIAGRAMVIAPIAVLPLAVAGAGAGWLAGRTGWPELLSGFVVVALLALGTRALHLDGLADTVDGLGSGWDRERALQIMRRGDVGPMGVVALILVLATQAVAVSTLTDDWRDAVTLAVLLAASRAALPFGCRVGVPPARPTGLGAMVAGTVPGPVAALVVIIAGGVVTGTVLATGRPWWCAVIALLLAAVAAAGTVTVAVRRFGGITGDVLGAGIELTFLGLLLGVSLG